MTKMMVAFLWLGLGWRRNYLAHKLKINILKRAKAKQFLMLFYEDDFELVFGVGH